MATINAALENRLCLITGATRGIGLGIAKALDARGAKLLLHGRNQKTLEKIRDNLSHPEKHSILFADLRSRQGIEKLAGLLCDQLSRLDVLIHNAGILGPRMTLESYPDKIWDEVMEVNLTAPFYLTQKLMPIIRKGYRASIVFVSSGAGVRGAAQWGAYAVSKFGLEGLSQVLADELTEELIKVNTVNPGGTRTAMRAAAFPVEDPLTLPTPDDIAPVFVYLARPDITITGRRLNAGNYIGQDPMQLPVDL